MNPLPAAYFASLLLCACLVSAAHASPWAQVKMPSAGPTVVIGETSNGCIAGAQSLPAEGPGYVSIRRYRNRHFGHPQLLRLVSDLGRTMARRGDALVMVGDLSQPRGGLMSSSHRSHQNGLDVDIWFRLAPSAAAANRDTATTADPPSMVTQDGEDLNRLWGEDQRTLLKAAAVDSRVDRIFVNPAIKQALCESETGDRYWLRKLRPWRGHDAHFHVRLKCPKDSPACEAQSSIGAGEGCGAELAWWFTEEARKPKRGGGAKPIPPMPAACRALLTHQDLASKQ